MLFWHLVREAAAYFLYRRQQQADQNSDDGDDDEQFDEREATPTQNELSHKGTCE